MKLRLILSLVIAVICAGAGIQEVSRSGDPSSKVAEFERALEASFNEKVVFSRDRQDGESLKRCRFKNEDGRVLRVEGDETLTPWDLEPLFSLLESGEQVSRDQLPPHLERRLGEVIQAVPGCRDLAHLWGTLTYDNQITAKAKVAVRYESEPMPLFGIRYRDSPWSRRFKNAASPWDIEEVGQLRTRQFGFGAAFAAAGFVGAFLGFAILSWMWRFLLRRISEISSAIRGKPRS